MDARGCLAANDWICGEYLRSRSQELTDATVQHVWITVVSVAIGLVVAFPLALLARAQAAVRRAGARADDVALHDAVAGDVLAAAAVLRAVGRGW